MNEDKIYTKVMGIEEARKANLPMPPSVKIPKTSRLSSSGGYCGVCGHNTLEGHEDAHGMWHYRCTFCIAHQKPDPNPCPRCRCTAHSQIAEICICVPSKHLKNPFQPDVTAFSCLNCGFVWNTPEYEKYLLMKVIKSVLPTSEFAEKRE